MSFGQPEYLMQHVIAEGRLNRLEGVKLEENPYASVNFRASWAAGWHHAEADIQVLKIQAEKAYWAETNKALVEWYNLV